LVIECNPLARYRKGRRDQTAVPVAQCCCFQIAAQISMDSSFMI